MEQESVWRALTSPHRRQILDLLREGPQTTGQLSKGMPGLSRFAVMQHLDVLVAASLVLIRREGRQRFNYLNASPLRELYDRWVTAFASTAAETGQHLRRYAESKTQEHKMDNMDFRVVKIEMEVEISAPPRVVFDALTKNMDEWWPHRFNEQSRIVHESRLGGTIREEWDGGGALYGTVTMFVDGSRVSSVAQGFMGACTIANDDVVEERGDGSVYKKSMKIWGDVPAEFEKMFREGSREILETSLRQYCEKGVKRA